MARELLIDKLVFESITVISGNTTLTAINSGTMLHVDTSGGAVTLTLPHPSTRAIYYIKDHTGSFQTNNLTLSRTTPTKIEGLDANRVLSTAWGFYVVYTNGTDWFLG